MIRFKKSKKILAAILTAGMLLREMESRFAQQNQFRWHRQKNS